MNLTARAKAALLTSAALVIAGTLGPTTVARAEPSSRVPACIWAPTGTDLHRFFDVTTSLVIPGGCDHVLSGARWSTPDSFYVARSWEHIPPGYVPDSPTPLAELEKHLTRVAFIVDEGTPNEFRVQRTASQLEWVVRDWQEVYPDDPDWVFADMGTHITIRPLSIGMHTIRGVFSIDAPACDGT
ncbi:MAG TPA: hypothetical protein VFL59_07560, partial [Candidatus Nanopelagicales bacterium]|nr:hypothetical protein [Candidatus Nanopelagicales bacterium]